MGNIPFGDDIMTIIMGIGGPEEPGMHGHLDAPAPDTDVIGFITKIRDMCDEYLMKCGKCCNENPVEKPSDDMADDDTDNEE